MFPPMLSSGSAFSRCVSSFRPFILSSTYHGKVHQAPSTTATSRCLETRRHMRVDSSQLPHTTPYIDDLSSFSQNQSQWPQPQGPHPEKQGKRRRLSRKKKLTLCSLVFLGIGWFTGKTMAEELYGHNVVEQGSEEDEKLMEDFNRGIEDWSFLRELRKNRQWRELYNDSDLAQPAFGAALRGSGGVCAERVFWNAQTKTAISVFRVGKVLNGWPGVVHGGLQATLHEDNLARLAHIASGAPPSKYNHYNDNSGTSSLFKHQLVVDYRKPAVHNQFFYIIAQVDQERSTENEIYTSAKLHNQMEKLCSESTARFVLLD